MNSEEKKPYVLYVDDDPTTRISAESIFSTLGIYLVFADSGKQALREILKHDFALIILDVFLPDMNGFEIASRIRERTQNDDTPIIFLTATDNNAENAIKGYAIGAVDYITKPVISEILRAKTMAFVKIYHQQQHIKKQAEQLAMLNMQLHGEIAERKKVEDALAKINEKLEIHVKERTAQIEATNQYLRQAEKIESIGKLAGGVAHDFNNILSVVLGYGQMALQQMAADDPLRKKLEAVVRAGERGASLTRQLLIFSRKQVVETRVINLNPVVIDFEKMLRRLIGENIEVTLALASDIGHINADPGRIEQIIMNLCINARDAMLGGGKLHIETANVTLDAAHVRKHPGSALGAHIMLAISDTGCGMSSDVLSHLFEPFFTTKEAGKGTGLGLSVVYGIVQQFGGSIAVASELNRGTTMKIYFPRVESSITTMQQQSVVVPKTHGETILVVDDEEDIRNMVQETLQNRGYKVLASVGGQNVLRLVETLTEPLHLLITDVVMPEMSGKELAEKIKIKYPQVKTLFMSGYTQDMIPKYDVDRDAQTFIEKPFMPAVLIEKVGKLLR
ncbi:MAG: response regulator [Planctomycetota bacterium]